MADGTESESAEDAAEGEEEYEWLTDENGKAYRVATIPKVERTYGRIRDDLVRFPGGATFQVVKESDDTFWVKVFKREKRAAPKPFQNKKSADEVAEIEARYDFQIEQVDRVALQAFDKGLPKRGQWRDGFDLADMNGDGHLDIVFGPARKSTRVPTIFLGDSQGNWSVWREAVFPQLAYDYGDVTVGDWNADGNLDLALGVHLRGLLALVGDGQGRFQLASKGIDFDVPGTRSKLDAFSTKAISAFDWNGDGKDDILAFGEGPKRNTGNTSEVVQGSVGFRVHLSQGDGSWEVVHLSPPTDRNFGSDFALLDVDGDGRQDVVTSTSQLGNQWLLLQTTTPTSAEVTKIDGLPERGVVDAVEVGDFNGDGRADIAYTYRALVLRKWRAGLDVLLRAEDGGWERKGVLSLVQREPFRAIAVGNVDGDGSQDLAVLDDYGVVRILLGQGDGSFVEELVTETPSARVGCQGYDAELRDLDGDGLDDLVATFAGEAQGMAAFTGSTISGCEGGGRLEAWNVKLQAGSGAESGAEPASETPGN